MKYLYLHGLGQNADSWNKVTRATEVSGNSACLDLAEMVKGKVATYSALYSAFSEMCNAENEDIILCGLSLGSVLALNYAIDYPKKVKALVLIAAQYKMPTRLLKLQNALFHFMPQSMFQQTRIRTTQIFHPLLAVINNRQNRRKALKSLGLLRNQNHPKLSSFIRCYP